MNGVYDFDCIGNARLNTHVTAAPKRWYSF